MPIEIAVNGKRYPVHYPPDTPLLSVLRDELRLTGTNTAVAVGSAARAPCCLGERQGARARSL